MIHELLGTGGGNARSGRELADFLNCDIRTITEQIEQERRAGHPICANMSGKHAGYYLPATPEELEDYCGILYHRGGELFKTRRALLQTLKQIKQQKEAAVNG